MPHLARGESRSRRSPSTEQPLRSRTRGSSQSPSFRLSAVPFLAFIDTLAHFVAASVFNSHPSLPSPLLAFPAFLFTSLTLLPLSSRAAFAKILPRIGLPVLLALLHLVLLFEGVARLGPARTLLATAAVPHLTLRTRRRRPKATVFCSLAAVIVLVLVGHDAAGGGARVGERVLRSRAGHAVTDRLQKISLSVGKTVRDNRPLRKLRERYRAPPPPVKLLDAPPPPLQPESRLREPPKPQSGDMAHEKAESRRRLLTTTNGENRVPVEEHHAANPLPEQDGGKTGDLNRNATIQKGTGSVRRENLSEIDKAERREQLRNTTEGLVGTSEDGGGARLLSEGKPSGSLEATLGVVVIVLSAMAGRAASEAKQRIVRDVGDSSSASTLILLLSSSLLFPFFGLFWILARMRDQSFAGALFGEIVPSGAFVGLGILGIPAFLQIYQHDGERRAGVQLLRGPSKGNQVSGPMYSSLLLLPEAGVTNGLTYSYVFLSILLLRRFGFSAFGIQETLSLSSFFAALLLLCISMLESDQQRGGNQHEAGTRERVASSSSGDLSIIFGRWTAQRLRLLWKSSTTSLSLWFSRSADLFVHARSNKASWQVLNFLVLQSGMAIVELIYATMTHAAGLISISADNFFCCVALTIGLQAIRVTTRKPTNIYTYGFSRFESVCGFVNGVMLIYVAVLIVLEAYERFRESGNIAVGHTFSVCLFGMTGNVLGLYFFPPESRRENHNVQGIYLHIWANTLAFASMAISTAITSAVRAWEPIDMVTAALVAVGVIALAIPLLIRSGRLLLLLVPVEKVKALASVRTRLLNIDGVVQVCGLRVWNLSPNCLVASVRLEIANYYQGQDVEVLYKARAVFASMGVPATQCTIQISRVEAENKAVVFFHKRSQSGFGDTGIDLEALTTSREWKEQLTVSLETN